MDFRVRRNREPSWSVKSSGSGLDGMFSDWTFCTITKKIGSQLDGTVRDRWLIGMHDPEELPKDLQYRHKRSMKDVECGIAALVPESDARSHIFTSLPVPKFFSTLPLPFPSELPVHVHATFLITGDRESIPIEESMRDAGADWNRWLLTHTIPRLYLAFLEDLGRKIEKDRYFTFWPQNQPQRGSLSELIFSSFWTLLPESSCRLFPVAPPTSAKPKTRQPPKVLEISGVTFDFLPEYESSILKEVLEPLIPTMVRTSAAIIEQMATQKIEVTKTTPQMLRQLFRDINASGVLKKAASANPKVLEVLLEIIKPIDDQDFIELDGCCCLPLADAT
jgi:sacsin